LRSEINKSKESNIFLAQKYGVSENTIFKWKNRKSLEDKSSRPDTIKYSLSELEMLIAVKLRTITWWALDEITEAITTVDPVAIRSAVYRTFVREGINRVPQKEKDKAKKFKEYEPGYLHMDVTYLPKLNGIKYYLFVAIDRATRTLFYQIYDAKTSANTEDFTNKCLDFFPFPITHILTDNGLEFTNSLIKSKKGEYCKKPSKLDIICEQNNIDHRLTKPFTPKTNGMVEKANDIIKNGTIKKNEYENIDQMNQGIISFLIFYNLYRRHGSLRRELKVKTPLNAVEKWYEIKPEIFTEKPLDFKNKILLLKSNIKQSCQQQPCET
jgi:transposase-like protein